MFDEEKDPKSTGKILVKYICSSYLKVSRFYGGIQKNKNTPSLEPHFRNKPAQRSLTPALQDLWTMGRESLHEYMKPQTKINTSH